MSFSFAATGNAEETVKVLRDQTISDPAGAALRDFIASGIERSSGELEAHKAYVVRAYGHSGADGFALSATVELGDRFERQPGTDPVTR